MMSFWLWVSTPSLNFDLWISIILSVKTNENFPRNFAHFTSVISSKLIFQRGLSFMLHFEMGSCDKLRTQKYQKWECQNILPCVRTKVISAKISTRYKQILVNFLGDYIKAFSRRDRGQSYNIKIQKIFDQNIRTLFPKLFSKYVF
jgi:hypothetical protein